MKKGVGILLIVAGLLLGYLGVKGLDKSSRSVEIGDAKVTATDEGGQSMAYVYLAGGILLLVGGIYTVSRREKKIL